jgi:hypothetical protein
MQRGQTPLRYIPIAGTFPDIALLNTGSVLDSSLCTICSLLICAVIIALFLGAFFKRDVSNVIGVIFIAALGALAGGLVHLPPRNLSRHTYLAHRPALKGLRAQGLGLRA